MHFINDAHLTIVTAHSGKMKTIKLITAQHYWSELLNDCLRFVTNCRIWHWTHISRDKTSDLLHLLLIEDKCWQHISFNFKSFLMNKKEYDNIFMIINHFRKRVFSLPCNKTVTAVKAAELYYMYMWRIYDTSETVTSDRDSQFISAFTDELCKLIDVKQKLFTVYHFQMNDSTEVLNQYINQQLHFFVNHFQNNWSDLLLMINYAQAILSLSATDMSLYELKLR